MKIRESFVSNSSSTSFCGFGFFMNLDELYEKLEKANTEKFQELLKADPDYSEDKCCLIEGIIEGTILSCQSTPLGDDYDWVIGGEFAEMPDDMTKAEYRKTVTEEILKAFPFIQEEDIEFHQEAWNDNF